METSTKVPEGIPLVCKGAVISSVQNPLGLSLSFLHTPTHFLKGVCYAGMIASNLQLHRYGTGRESRVVTAMTLLKSHLFK
jgi:hypothetical protein